MRDVESCARAAPAPTTPRVRHGVYLMAAGKARFQPIRTGLMGDLSVEVRSGLAGGETLITGPFRALRTLRPGDVVAVEKPKPAGDDRGGGAEGGGGGA